MKKLVNAFSRFDKWFEKNFGDLFMNGNRLNAKIDKYARIDRAYTRYQNHFAGYEDVPTKVEFMHELEKNPKFASKWLNETH